MKKVKKRKVDVVVLSDIHLGTYGSRPKELLNYLRTIKPKTIILNGDIIDMWQFSKRYFPKSHMQILLWLAKQITRGTTTYYITGNHDEMLRRFVGLKMGSLRIVNKVVLELDNKKAWFFHGDVFDVTMRYSKWLAKLGGLGYDLLIVLNTLVNWVSERLLGRRFSLSKRIKNSVKSAVKFISDFENTAIDIAFTKQYDYVVCGHIHHPQIRVEQRGEQQVTYLNSGDWVENLTALEYHKGEWSIYDYQLDETVRNIDPFNHSDTDLTSAVANPKDLFEQLLREFQFLEDQPA
ncbi:MAG: UDP-2,3-diacylglucosamine diphosphatase [Bacteroidetes bacterium]|nr:UDP-2,3-diacylglucosamine diphosphatase [Bacteroidota bacterium]